MLVRCKWDCYSIHPSEDLEKLLAHRPSAPYVRQILQAHLVTEYYSSWPLWVELEV